MKRALALLLCPSILAAQIGGGGINNPPTPGANYTVVFNNTPGWLQNLGTGADGPNTNASGNLAGNRNYTDFTVPFGNTLTINNTVGLTIHATGACIIAGTITGVPGSTTARRAQLEAVRPQALEAVQRQEQREIAHSSFQSSDPRGSPLAMAARLERRLAARVVMPLLPLKECSGLSRTQVAAPMAHS